MNLSPVQIINDYVASMPSEPYPKDYWRASSGGYCQRKVYMLRRGDPISNEISPRARRVFEAGHIFHAWIQNIMAIHYGSELTHAEENIDIKPINVKGHVDNILTLRGTPTVVDYKTQHSRSFWHGKKEGGMLAPQHRIQVGTYLMGLQERFPGINGMVVYISKDDLTMEQIPVIWSEQLKRDVLRYWDTLNFAWDESEPPECTCVWEMPYCPFLKKIKRTSYKDETGKRKQIYVGECCGENVEKTNRER